MRAHRGLAIVGALVVLVGGARATALAGVPGPTPPAPALDDAYSVDEDQTLTVDAPGVLGNDTTTPTSCAAAVDTSTLAGQLTLESNGRFTFTPDANFNGETSFTYRLATIGPEGCGEPFAGEATVTITVNAVNDAPIAVEDSFQFVWGQTLNIPGPGVLANDSDIDTNKGELTAVEATGPARGFLTLAPNGGFSYTPAAAACPGQADAFSYRASDGSATSAIRIVRLNPAAVPCPTPFVSPTPAPTPTPTPTPSPTIEPSPSPTLEPSPSPEPSASLLPTASPSSAPSPTPGPTGVPGPVNDGGGISLPVLLVVVLLGALLAFGGAFYLPRVLGRAGSADVDQPDDPYGRG